eukprot:1181401-Prorocentrum_minimum.AAC.3
MASNVFTPWTCALGGLTMGIATFGKLYLTGRVLGISGAIKCWAQGLQCFPHELNSAIDSRKLGSNSAIEFTGMLHGDFAAWRVSFMAGLGLAGLYTASAFPEMIQTLPPSFTPKPKTLTPLQSGPLVWTP